MISSCSPGLRVLLLEDGPDEATWVTRALECGDPEYRLLRVDTRAAFAHALGMFRPDVILSDQGACDLPAIEALRLAQDSIPACPFLLIGCAFQQMASDCFRAGAADFIRKETPERLCRSIGEAIRARAPLRKLSQRQRQVLLLMMAGRSTREIAAQLCRSIKTVEAHRAQLTIRLGIHDLAGLVRYAVGVGFIPSGGDEIEPG